MIEANQQFIGRVVCDREIGENLCLGHVEYPEQQEHPCVIQFLPDDRDELARRRLANEAMIGFDVSRDHQNLVTTLHFGTWDDGRLFLAVDCVEGRALSELLDGLRGNHTAVRAIADAALRALLFLHGRGVAHNAVGVENFLMGADGILRLGNFSRARRISDRADGADDLRALGALLFYIATGTALSEVDSRNIKKHLGADAPADLILAIARLLSGSWEGLVGDGSGADIAGSFAVGALGAAAGIGRFGRAIPPLRSGSPLGALGTLFTAAIQRLFAGCRPRRARRMVYALTLLLSTLGLSSYAMWLVSSDSAPVAVPVVAPTVVAPTQNAGLTRRVSEPVRGAQSDIHIDTVSSQSPLLNEMIFRNKVYIYPGRVVRSRNLYKLPIQLVNNSAVPFQVAAIEARVGGSRVPAQIVWVDARPGCSTYGRIDLMTACSAKIHFWAGDNYQSNRLDITIFDADENRRVELEGLILP